MLPLSKRIIIGGALGNALEMYDYVIWGLFSVYLSKEFLPPNANLSDIFFLFLLTYILRPIGSLIGGILADQAGRKKILTLSISLMGICTSIVGILPSYAQIGVISVFLLLFIRLIQVFAVGSEYISSLAFLIESCHPKQRGFFGSWAAFGVNAGVLISSLIGSLILYLMDLALLPPWGWRLAFILAFITMIIGYWIRHALPESVEFIKENARNEKRAFLEVFYEAIAIFKSQLFDTLLIFFLVCFGVSTTILVFIYAPIHITTLNPIHNTQAFIINTSSLSLLVLCIPFFGYLSDKIGQIKIIFTSSLLLLLIGLPYFKIISSSTFYSILLAHTLIAIPCASLFAVTPVLITAIFPFPIRCAATNLIYSLAACIGRGVTLFIASTLAHHTAYWPGYIFIFLGGINLIFLVLYQIKIKNLSLFRSISVS